MEPASIRTRADPKATRLFSCPLEQVTLHGPPATCHLFLLPWLVPVHGAPELRSLPFLARAEEKNSPYCPAACEKEEQYYLDEAVAPVRSGSCRLSAAGRPALSTD